MEMFYAHQLTFEQCKVEQAKGTAITTVTGHLICSRDRRISDKELWQVYRAEIVQAIAKGIDLSEEVIRSNNDIIVPQIQAGTTVPLPAGSVQPVVAPAVAQVLNAKGRPFSWSHSALEDFSGTFGCPLKYAHSRFYCDTKFVESEAMKRGNQVHKSGEVFVRDGVIDNPESFTPVEKYARLFRGMKEQGVEITPELEIVLDKNQKPLLGKDAWFSKNAWFRCKIDVPVIRGIKAAVYDYKTGAKIKEDSTQLHLCLAALAVTRPELEEFSGKLIWTKFQETTGCADLTRAEALEVWDKTLVRVQRAQDAWDCQNFPAIRNGLCKQYCEVFDCPHNGRGR